MRKTFLFLYFLAFIFLLKTSYIYAQPGIADNSFATGTGFDSYILASAIQSDGKILAGGGFTNYNGTNINRIVRLNTNGSIDASFNVGSGFNGDVWAMALQSDGKILVGGGFTNYNGTSANRLIRLNTNGSVDNTFNMGTGVSAEVYAINIQSTGKIIIGGRFAGYNNVTQRCIARLNTDGTLDNTFNIGSGLGNTAITIAIQNDDKILVGGFLTSYNGTSSNRIVRINTNGTIDNTFNTGSGFNDNVYKIQIQPDGKILVGGDFTSYNSTGYNFIVRLNTNGSADATFNIGTGTNNIVRSVAIQSDGRIVIGGWFSSYNGTFSNNIIRLNSNGSADLTFNVGQGTSDTVWSISLQTDGKIIVLGYYSVFNETVRNSVVRLYGNSFGINLQSNAITIPKGDFSPNMADNTEIRTAVSTPITRTYTIQNLGTNPLTVNSISNSNTTDFAVGGITLPTTIGVGGSRTFTITINTIVTPGVKNTTITINNNDPDASAYDFGIVGKVIQTAVTRNNALRFDGVDDNVSLSGLNNPLRTNNFTMEMWIKPTGSIQDFDSPMMFRNSDNSSACGFTIMNNREVRANWGTVGYWSTNSNLFVNLNEWNHIAMVITSTTITLYVNGVGSQIASNQFVQQVNLGIHPNKIIGNDVCCGSRFFQGEMDEVRIWNMARTQTQIRENMHLTLSGTENNLIAYYQFNESAGNTIIDAVNGSNGTLNNGVARVASSLSVGGGSSQTFTIGAIGGITTEISSTIVNAEIDFSNGGIAPNGEVVVFQINAETPFNNLSTPTTSAYWIVRNFGANQTNLAINTISFKIPSFNTINATDEANPNNLKLYKRNDNSGDITWGGAFVASANTASNTTKWVNFSGSGFNTFSEFIITTTGTSPLTISSLPNALRGNMLNFNSASNQYVSLPNNPLANANEMTIETWFFPTSYNAWARIIDFGDSAGDNMFLAPTRSTTLVPRFVVNINNLGESVLEGTSPLPLNTWSHIAITISAKTATMYVNGIQVSQNTTFNVNTQNLGTTANNWLGRSQYASDPFLGGVLDEMRLWNVARTQRQIRENMHLTLGGRESGLVAYYQFNETSGNVIDVVRGNNGTLQNGVSRNASTLSVGGGRSETFTIGATGVAGAEASLSTTNVEIDFTTGGTAPNGELVVFQMLAERPFNALPPSTSTTSSYWIIRNFGANQTGLALNSISFKIPNSNIISATDEATPANLKLYKRNDNSGDITWGGSPIASANSANNTTKRITFIAGGFSSFSEFVISSTFSALPVTLLEFKGKRVQGSNGEMSEEIKLEWTTLTELNNAGFEVQISENGKDFARIAFVDGNTNQLEITNYELGIEQPNSAYFRLKQVDFSGNFSYSNIIFIKGFDKNDIKIYPNPASDFFQIKTSLPDFTYKITDIQGKLFDTKHISQDFTKIDISNFSNGIYLIQILQNGKNQTKKMVIQK